jgi:hypothetical protein
MIRYALLNKVSKALRRPRSPLRPASGAAVRFRDDGAGRGDFVSIANNTPTRNKRVVTLPPTPAAVAEHFRRKRSVIAALSKDDVLNNERLWVVDICGLPETELDPAPIIDREEAARLDDPFKDTSKFGLVGQYTNCARCGAVFESLGLGLCSGCCKSSHAPRPKSCQECDAPLDSRGRTTMKFCSDACRQKAQYRTAAVTASTRVCYGNSAGRLPGPDTLVSVSQAQANQGLPEPPIRNTPPVRCADCRREFQPGRKDTKFCSTACKQRAYRSEKRTGQRTAA